MCLGFNSFTNTKIIDSTLGLNLTDFQELFLEFGSNRFIRFFVYLYIHKRPHSSGQNTYCYLALQIMEV